MVGEEAAGGGAQPLLSTPISLLRPGRGASTTYVPASDVVLIYHKQYSAHYHDGRLIARDLSFKD
jgi:hypothetical protein